ncbi:MAG: transposase [Burkholderiales bacterium]|nr:transposase [Burkholderiales bacterium]
MSRYRRSLVPGGTYFFTVNLADRRSHLLVEHVDRLRTAFQTIRARRPFQTVAACVLPDHLHAIWRLPEDDADFGGRWSLVKRLFSSGLPAGDGVSPSKIVRREKGIWQRRFWEHQIRDETDLRRHVDYVHFNPVRHGWVQRVRDWPHSSFHAYVKRGTLPEDWAGGIEVGDSGFGERVGF